MIATRAGQIDAARSGLVRSDLHSTHRFATTLLAENPSDAEGHFLLGIAESSAGRIAPQRRFAAASIAID